MTESLTELLDLISHQEQTIVKQNEIIAKLVNGTAEQENIINALMREKVD